MSTSTGSFPGFVNLLRGTSQRVAVRFFFVNRVYWVNQGTVTSCLVNSAGQFTATT